MTIKYSTLKTFDFELRSDKVRTKRKNLKIKISLRFSKLKTKPKMDPWGGQHQCQCPLELLISSYEFKAALAKGQLISECLLGLIDFPKDQRKS